MMRRFIAGAIVLISSGCDLDSPGSLRTAAIEIEMMGDAILRYQAKTGASPSKLSDLSESWEHPFYIGDTRDPWHHDYIYIRPSCLISRGPDGAIGTDDDLTSDCDSARINQQVLLEAGLKGELARRDIYGRPIHFVHSGKVLLAWSYGQDGQPDTQDDQVARIAESAVRKE